MLLDFYKSRREYPVTYANYTYIHSYIRLHNKPWRQKNPFRKSTCLNKKTGVIQQSGGL